ncbi:MAG TPA: DUF1080 domain-containing protein [Candidatus Sumerlaeota bacterium]|nr:DUF1080 domain-containing protein [Candidatus Sumerlaeota bacterium]
MNRKAVRNFALLVGFLMLSALSSAADCPFVGNWALTIPGGGAGWLGVEQKEGYLDAGILWGGGSIMPVDSVFVDKEGKLVVTRNRNVERKDKDGKVVRTHVFTEAIFAELQGDNLKLTQMICSDGGVEKNEFTGKRIPPVPAKPDLAKVKFGKAIQLLKKNSLDGWKLTDPNATNGWSVKDGVLTNDPKEHGKSYGNIRTEKEFEDFNLKLETKVDKGGNSGIYLRGIYEVQVADTAGKGLDSHNMGGIYSRITPTESAEKPAGEWQTFDITLVDRHVTVILNGKKIIDNQPVLGCTGGALWSDEFKPGPLYLQGDHTGAQYRNVVLTPVVK